MINLYTSSLIKYYENNTIEKIGVPSVVLMERAAIFVYEAIIKANPSSVLIVCGSGNNGGDGLAIARMLKQNSINVNVLYAGDLNKASELNKLQFSIYKNLGGIILDDIPNMQYDMIVDAIFGIGLSRDVKDKYNRFIDYINECKDRYGTRIYGVDIPSGIDSDTGCVRGNAVKCEITYTFGRAKTGLLLCDGPEYTGNLVICNIGIEFDESNTKCLEISDIKYLMPYRKDRSNKGTFGKVLIIAGCDDMPGAAFLSSKSAFVSGCGMVKLLTTTKAKEYIFNNLYECMVEDITQDNFNLDDSLNWADVVLIGPGLSQSNNAIRLFDEVIKKCSKPLIIDADGLNILSSNLDALIARKEKGLTTILTPHPGEFKRLFKDYNNIDSYQNIDVCMEIAAKYGIILVSKDAKTIITDGKSVFINDSGSNAMATAGSGDVLSGMIASLAFNSSDKLLGAALAVFIHGLAGENASNKKNNYSVIASDIIDGIEKVISDNVK